MIFEYFSSFQYNKLLFSNSVDLEGALKLTVYDIVIIVLHESYITLLYQLYGSTVRPLYS